MFTTTADYQRITRDLDRTLKLKASEPTVARETEYYLSRIGEIKSIDEFIEDTRVFNYAMKAFGLEEMSYAKAFMRKVLTEGIDDQNSFANKLVDKRYRDFAEAFNFKKLGAATTSVGAQGITADNYTRRTLQDDDIESDYYLSTIGNIETIDAFLENTRVYTFAMKAFGLEDMIDDKDFMRTVLTEGIDDADSFANQLADKRYREFAKAFNFASYGASATDFMSAGQNIVDRYLDQSAEFSSSETDYYLSNISEIESIDEFIGDSRIFDFALKSFWLEDANPEFIRELLEKGAGIIDSVADELDDIQEKSLRSFAETFNFKLHGAEATTFESTRQGTVDLYMRETLEIDAGEQNQGLRLALYFERKASGITSALSILADKALTKFAQTALGIPAMSSTQDIDKQAAEIEKRLDIEDLKDPEKLDKLILRFTTMWELENPSEATAAPNVLIGQPLGSGFSTELIASLQNLKRGGF